EKAEANGHCGIKTFGAGAELTRDRWRSLFRQALTGGLIEIDHARGGALKPTDKGWEVIQGKREVRVTEPPRRAAFIPVPRSRGAEGLPPTRAALWEDLRLLRRTIASERGVPPYVVFQDVTLAALVASMP